MTRAGLTLLFLLLLPVTLAAQSTSETGRRTPPDPARRAAEQARRDSLEVEIAQKFLEQLTRELRLDAAQRTQMERVLQESGQRRRELMRASFELRGRMFRALRDRNTADADFTKLLADHEQLRIREHDLWRRDQEELTRFLTPRQRTQFLIEWDRFQQRVRSIIEQRSGEHGPGKHQP